MDRQGIMNIIPHRPPMLLVDEAHMEGDDAVGSYTVRGDEFFLQGHFPDNPIVPGVILCEMMAQCACVLFTDAGPGITPYFAGLDQVRFRSKVHPGDTIVFRSHLTKTMGPFRFLEGSGYVGDELCVTASLSVSLQQA